MILDRLTDLKMILPDWITATAKAIEAVPGPFGPSAEDAGITEQEFDAAMTFLSRTGVRNGSRPVGDPAKELEHACRLAGVAPAPAPTVIVLPGEVHFPGIVLPWGKNGIGLQSRKQWSIELCCCNSFGRSSAAVVRLGAGIFEPHVDVDTGTFWVGLDRVSDWTGYTKTNIQGWRNKLRDAGWIVETGERHNRAKVYRIEVPACQCGHHGRYQRPAKKR